MLEAHRTSWMRSRWEVRRDGAPLAVLAGNSWSTAVRYTLDGQPYEVSSNWLGTRYTLRGPDDAGGQHEAAEVRGIGRKRWSIVTAGGEDRHFRRRSIWRADQEWVAGPDAEEVLGTIRRTGTWRGDAEADLPGMPTPTALLTLATVLLMWDQFAAAAAAT